MAGFVGQGRTTNAPSPVSLLLNENFGDSGAGNQAIASIFPAMVAKVPVGIRVYVNTVTGATPPDYTYRIEPVTAGVPTGTPYHANATKTVNLTTPTGWKTVTFASAPSALVVGTRYAIVISAASGASGASNLGFRSNNLIANTHNLTQRGLLKTSGAWEALSVIRSPFWCAIEFSDGTFSWGMDQNITASNSTQAVVLATTTTFQGVKFTSAVSGPLVFVDIPARHSTGTGNLEVVLRASAGGSDLAVGTLSQEILTVGAVNALAKVVFATPATITKGTSYTVYLRPLGTSQYNMVVGPVTASAPPLPEALSDFIYVSGAAEPPVTGDAQYHPYFRYGVDAAGSDVLIDGLPIIPAMGLGTVALGETLTVPLELAEDATGSPTYKLYADESGTAITSGSFAKLDDAGTVGLYSEQFTISTGTGFAAGKSYSMYVEAVIGSITWRGVIHFRVSAATTGDVNVTGWKGATPCDLPVNFTDPATGGVAVKSSGLALGSFGIDVPLAAVSEIGDDIQGRSLTVGTNNDKSAYDLSVTERAAITASILPSPRRIGSVLFSGANSTLTFATTLSAAKDNTFVDMWLLFTSGANVDQVKRITASNVAAVTVTVEKAFTDIPSAGDTFILLNY